VRFLDCDFAKALQAKARAPQSGTLRQVHERTTAWLWRAYRDNVGEGPEAAEAHTPLLFSLQDLYTTDRDGFFDGLVQDQCGSHIPKSATGYQANRLACIRTAQKEWDEKNGNLQASRGSPPTPLTSTFSQEKVDGTKAQPPSSWSIMSVLEHLASCLVHSAHARACALPAGGSSCMCVTSRRLILP
jgi:hypothetical protein